MKRSFKHGKIAGISLNIHWTFSLLLTFIIFVNYKNGQNLIQILWSFLFILSVFVTVFLHELGHALAAKNYHINTKDITLLPIGGLARLDKIPEKPLEKLVVAIAGSLVNITLAIITGLFITIPSDSNELSAKLSNGVNVNNFFFNFFILNFWLALFNLMPAFPMDGGRILRALFSFKLERNVATKIAARIGQFIAVGFILLGFLYNPFLVFIGIFVIIDAQVESDSIQSKHLLKRFKVRDILMKQYPIIDAHEKLKTVIDLLFVSQNKNFLVTDNAVPVGTLNRDQIILAWAKKGENKTINNLMDPNLIFLEVDSSIKNIFEDTYKNKSTLMLITENNEVIKALDTENLLEFILIEEVKLKKDHAA